MKRIRKKRMQETVELNITAFLNLMVVLVPFLLITAVFSRMTVLELNLPALDAAAKEANKDVKLQLQVLITPDSLVVQDALLGKLKEVGRREDGTFNWKYFTDVLLEIKSRFPEEQNIALLMDPKVTYRTMIDVMDHVRYAEIVQTATVELVELFPNVSVGDAPSEQVVTEGDV
ncbi:ExbD/TolR family protein [Teredinibacter turnerae]|uniref:ExbD/TolR family protein n=1 Tax=Teredinibacter turnerae TaxID=2426 RepID=UPI0005F7769F|nr:biopolymer transporter ExbD [Teredinibacter turnerae]